MTTQLEDIAFQVFPIVMRFSPAIKLTEKQFYELCQLNQDLKLESTAAGELIIMPPTGGETGNRNSELTFQLQAWSRQNPQLGLAFDE